MSAETVVADLIQAIRDTPDDMAPRLIMADWFEERGDPRGEYIRTQCRLKGPGLNRNQRERLHQRAEILLDANRAVWAESALAMGARFEFRDGFLHTVVGNIERVLEHWQPLVAREPLVHAELTYCTGPGLRALAESGFLRHLRHLTIRGTVGAKGLSHLARAPGLAGLERLNLKDTDTTDDGVQHLAGVPGFQPRRLTLTGNDITDASARALAESSILTNIERLYLSRTAITDDGVEALAQSPHLGKLQELALGSLEEFSPGGAQVLIDSPYLTSLRYLEVNTCWELDRSAIHALQERFAKVRSDYS